MSEGFRLTATNLSTNHVDGACANGIGNARSWNLYIEGYASGPANAGRNASTLVQCVDVFYEEEYCRADHGIAKMRIVKQGKSKQRGKRVAPFTGSF